MNDDSLLIGERIPLQNARFYFHEVTPCMMDLPGFSQSIKREFLRALYDNWYREKHLAFAAFDDCHFVLLVSYSKFSLCNFSDYELMQILALCEEDMTVCVGSPCVIDLDRLHKHRLVLA
ncbi:hypothetical protein [Cellvibrio mixtus]|uniref:hypothetical protein n=1 Tax=Cellvibrio mixtus TaxID=39650 RepID=UPI000586EE70|nr:hypothetical protein [Cellvibrio mixtus]